MVTMLLLYLYMVTMLLLYLYILIIICLLFQSSLSAASKRNVQGKSTKKPAPKAKKASQSSAKTTTTEVILSVS